MSTQDIDDVPTLKKVLTSKKRNFTRQFNACGKATRFASVHPTPDAAEVIREHQSRLTKAYGELMEVLDTLQTLDDPKESDLYEQGKEDTQDRFDESQERIISCLEEIVPTGRANLTAPPAGAAGGGVAGGGGGARLIKIQESLKPFLLTRDHNPIEFRTWCLQFRSFYNASHLELLDVVDQQAYFRINIQPILADKVFDEADDNTPIFGAYSCMNLLNDEFAARYPLATRRFEYFQLSPQPGQLFSDFLSKLLKHGKEADLAKLEVEDLHCYRCITACPDAKLRDKFLRVDNPTIKEFEAIIRTYEKSSATSKVIDDSTSVKQVKSKPIEKGAEKKPKSEQPQRSQRPPRPQQPQHSSQTSGPSSEQNPICHNCEAPRHKSLRDCPKFGSECTWCGMRNHLEKFCRAKAYREKTRSNVKQISSLSSSDDEDIKETTKRTYHRVSVIKSPHRDTPRLHVTIRPKSGPGSFSFQALPDSGATKSIVAFNLLRRWNIPFQPSNDRLFAANDEEMACEGKVTLRINGVKIIFIVSSSMKEEMLISWHDLVNLGILPADFPSVLPKPQVKSFKSCHVKSSSQIELKAMLDPILDNFPDVLSDTLPDRPMFGKEMTIEIDSSKNVTPRKVTTTKPIPVHWQDEATKLVQNLVSSGIIEEVHDETSDWVSPAFFVPKPNGSLRLVTDFSRLNRAIKRPVHPFPSANDIAQNIPSNSCFFAKFDALQGYHQIPLAHDSRHLTTFLLPMGKYRYCRGPMGLRSTNDVYCAKSDRTIAGVEGCQKIVDDILVCAVDVADLCSKVEQVLLNCRKQGITISRKKIDFGSSLAFAGFQINSDGVFPDPEKISALTCFPAPTNITELRSFLGLANQLGGFVKDLAQTTDPLRQLLKKGVSYQWTPDLDEAFESAKQLLSSPSLVHFFDPSLDTYLLSDASCLNGLGFALVQYEKDSKTPRLVQCGSRSLTGPESRYAPIELECLGIAWATEKCRHFLLGHPCFTIVTDHAPLLGIFQKDLTSIDNRRLQRFRERLQPYVFDLTWKAGKVNLIADAFSRRPVSSPGSSDHLLVRSVAAYDEDLHQIFSSTKVSPEYSLLKEAIISRKPVSSLPPDHPAHCYQSVWSLLSVGEDDLIIYDGSKILVPTEARSHVLRFLHLSHCGFVKTKHLAKELYYWPNMVPAIKSFIGSCPECTRLQASRPQEPILSSSALYPMEFVGVDLFQAAGVHFLVLVDRFSGFPLVHKLRSLSTSSVTSALLNWFLLFGFPKRLRSDGGPQFRSEFSDFCSSFGIEKETSSPYHAQSNGLAEAAVKQTKRLLKKCNFHFPTFQHRLLHWRNIPRADGFSPAQMFFGFRQNFGQFEISPPPFIDRKTISLSRSREHASSSKELPPFAIGDRVLIQNPKTLEWDNCGVIDSLRRSGRSFNLICDDGFKTVRNRKLLRPCP